MFQDNYQRSQVERLVRKPRKKTKQSALTRPPKKGKKRKKLTPRHSRHIGLGGALGVGAAGAAVGEMLGEESVLENCLDLPSSDTEKGVC